MRAKDVSRAAQRILSVKTGQKLRTLLQRTFL